MFGISKFVFEWEGELVCSGKEGTILSNGLFGILCHKKYSFLQHNMASSPNKSVRRKHIPTPINFLEIVLVLPDRIIMEIKPPKNKNVKYIAPIEYRIVFMIFILHSPFSIVLTLQFEEPYNYNVFSNDYTIKK